jgi:hypothetical protein
MRSEIQAAVARFAASRQDALSMPLPALPLDEVAEPPVQSLPDAQRLLEWL